MSNNLREYKQARDHLFERLVIELQKDDRVLGAWLSGSFGRQEADEWADYDLIVAVDDEAMSSFLADRDALYARIGEVHLLQDEIPGQGDVSSSFNLVSFAGGIEVDWSYVPASEAKKPVGHQVLFERRPFPVVVRPALTDEERKRQARRWAIFFWAMAPIAVKYVARGEIRRAAAETNLLSRALISLWRLIEQPQGSDPWLPDDNRPLEDHLDERLPQPGRALSPRRLLTLIDLLCTQAIDLQESLAVLQAEADPRMIADTKMLLQLARDEVARRHFRKRKYR